MSKSSFTKFLSLSASSLAIIFFLSTMVMASSNNTNALLNSNSIIGTSNNNSSEVNVCCESFGYGANMIKTASTYSIIPKSQCAVCTSNPSTGIDKCISGGGRNIVDNSHCTKNNNIAIITSCANANPNSRNECCTSKGSKWDDNKNDCVTYTTTYTNTTTTTGNASENMNLLYKEVIFNKNNITVDGVTSNNSTMTVTVAYANVTLSKNAEGWTTINAGESSAKTKSVVVGNDDGVFVETSKGREKINISPSQAAQSTKNELGNNYSMEIVEFKEGLKYVASSQKKIRILGIIPAKTTYTVSIDTQTGVVKLSKPWYTAISIVAK